MTDKAGTASERDESLRRSMPNVAEFTSYPKGQRGRAVFRSRPQRVHLLRATWRTGDQFIGRFWCGPAANLAEVLDESAAVDCRACRAVEKTWAKPVCVTPVAALKAENERLRAVIARALHELDPPAFYGEGSVWNDMLETLAEPSGGSNERS